MKKTISTLFALSFVVFAASGAWSQTLPTAKPEQVGLSTARLARITELVRGDVEKGRLPGAVVLVARRGQVVYHEAIGFRDTTAKAPITTDAIFRIYSMTKPMTSLAVMILVEEGRLQLTDPVSRYLPELGKLNVGVEKTDPATGKAELQLVPAEREMTIQDLLRHTSGLTYGVFGKSAVKELYTKEGVDGRDHTNTELIGKIAKVPLQYQPGARWEYGRSTDVLGRVVEVVSGKTLSAFLEDRVIAPLKMTDSAFWVPKEKQGRIAQPLAADPDTGRPIRLIDVTVPPKYEAGGEGAVSTAMDYARFCQMLLNGGQLDGVRLVSRKTVEYMTSDQLGDAKYPFPGWGFGLGFAVRREAGVAGQLGSVGEYTWAGFGGTSFWVDPKENLIVIWMAQGPGQRMYYRGIVKNLVTQSIVD